MLEISTSTFIKPKKILVDGHQWEMRPPGAGQELALNQAQRRIKLLDQKIERGDATEADYDLYDSLELKMMGVFESMFKDSTGDNHEVAAWIRETPMAVIQLAIEDITRQSEQQDKPVEAPSDGNPDQPTA